MKNNAAIGYAVILVIGDFLTLLLAFSLAYILRVKVDTRSLIEPIAAKDYFIAMFSVLPLWIGVHALIDLYSQKIYDKRFKELGRLIIGSFLGILVVIGYDFITDGSLFPARLVPVYGFGLGFVFLLLFRTLARKIKTFLYSYGVGVSNVLIVGDTKRSIEIADGIKDSKISGQRVLGIVGSSSKEYKTYKDFRTALQKIGHPIQSIIQTELYKDQYKNDEVLRFAQTNHAAYRFVPGNSDLFVGNIEVDLFSGSIPVIAVHQTALIGWGRIAKRVFDILSSAILIVIFSPLMLLTAIAVKLGDPKGPVLMKGNAQKRLTRFNRVIKVHKFRSHYAKFDGKTDEEVFKMIGKPELLEEYRKNGDKLENDFRVTAVGKFIRRTSLDELPQLFNVFKGDISLVGPRALVPSELDAYDKKHTILSVKSGLTGLAQISGRRNISFEERRRLDTYYVQNWSFWLDVTILLKTLRTVVDGIFES
jgi:exopolysaccharide biosynthesis polyprenyl glycosylphosphotransferase